MQSELREEDWRGEMEARRLWRRLTQSCARGEDSRGPLLWGESLDFRGIGPHL